MSFWRKAKTMTERAHARNTDPETSHAAAASLPDERLRRSQQAVYDVLQHCGPLTDVELIMQYQRYGGLPAQSESGIRTRRSELVRRGMVEWTGEKRRLVSGRQANVWVAL